jgi:FAD binding domain
VSSLQAARRPVQPGLVIRQTLLPFGGIYFATVSLADLNNFVTSATDQSWTFLNSRKTDCTASIAKMYSLPTWFDDIAVLDAASIEGVEAVLFIRALLRFRGNGAGVRELYQALAWNLTVGFAFLVGTEFFVAYRPRARYAHCSPSARPINEPNRNERGAPMNTPTSTECSVLVVGAGPVGPLAGCELARRGVAVRVIVSRALNISFAWGNPSPESKSWLLHRPMNPLLKVA